MNRRSLWLLTVLLLASTHLAQAQQPRKLSRIGFLGSGSFSTQKPLLDILSQRLRELGYIEGQNIVIESRFAEGKDERYADLAAELVRLRPDVIVTVSTTATFAARQASSTIPIVAGSAGDLVGAGLVASIARPGGNVTGSTNIDPDLGAKRLELLREFFPNLSRLAVLYHGGLGGDDEELKEMQDRARTFKIQVQPLEVKDPSQFSATYAAMKRDSAAALIILRGGFTKFHLTELPGACGKESAANNVRRSSLV
jgi:putative tryptophan/tyrosine transport system substrate-binding protein